MANGDQEMMMKPEGYPSDEEMEVSPSSASTSASTWNHPFFGTHNDMSLLESGLLQRNMDDMGENYYKFQAENGKPVDPKLLSLLVYFRELFVVSEEVFNKIFPGLHDEVVESLQKFGAAISQVKSDRMKVRTMQRSLSIGSPRTPYRDGVESPSTSRLEYFKVRTVRINGGGGQQGGQGSGGSK